MNARPGSRFQDIEASFRALQLAGRPEAAAQLERRPSRSAPIPLPDWYSDQARPCKAAGALAEDVLRPLDTGIVRPGPLPALS